MNKLYRHIGSKTPNRPVVAAEYMQGGGNKKAVHRWKIAAALATSALSSPAWADDLPTGGQIVSGSGTIASNGSAMTINQSTDRMIADWQGFSIGANNSVTFNQPGASAVALNRVVGQDPSRILGSLNANGHVFLINPNGIAIGQTGQVQTGGFVASTLGITNENFLAGNYQFAGTGGAITNEGDVSGHVVALIAPNVSNSGTITGSTALAAGTDVLLDFDGDGLLSVEVKGNTLAGLVENKGLIRADGGTAILSAKGASEALKGVVNNTGTVEARTIARKNGRILLLGDMSHGEVRAAGTLRAKSVETSAAEATIDKDLIVDTDGGHWLIDPTDVVIDAAVATAIQNALGHGSVTYTTATGGTDEGNITVNAPITWGAHTLLLDADNDIVINAPLTSTGTTINDGLILRYAQTTATGSYTINAPVSLATGSLFRTQYANDTAVNYTVLNDVAALQGMNGGLSGNYVLGSDIDASATSGWNWNTGGFHEGFAPVGDNSTLDAASQFNGIFDGLGHTINGLYINRTDPSIVTQTTLVGLFGAIGTGTVMNVGMVGGLVDGRQAVGLLAGLNLGTISNAYATGDVYADRSHAGGLVGQNNGTILNSYATGNVTSIGGSTNAYVGGLVGTNVDGTISNSYATGNVVANYNGGGLVGSNSGTITDAYATGNVYAGSYAGGLTGGNSGALTNVYATGNVSGGTRIGGLSGTSGGGTITNAYATGNVHASGNYAGGLVGLHSTWAEIIGGESVYHIGSISNAYATGAVSGDSGFIGGLVGGNYNGTVSNSYAIGSVTGGQTGGLIGSNVSYEGFPAIAVTNSFYDQETTGQSDGDSDAIKGTGLSTAEMQDPFTFIDAGWDFAGVWGKSSLGENGGYMTLRAFDTTSYDHYVRLAETDTTRSYGGADPALTGIAVDGVGTGNVSFGWGSAITAGTGVGTYAYGGADVLDVSVGSGSAYIDYGSGALNITRAPLTVAANDHSKTYDGLAFTGGNGLSYSGFVNGETESVLGGSVAYGGTAQNAVNAGSYTITASGITSGNYAINYVDGALAVNKAALTISTTDVTKTYDGLTSASGAAALVSGQFFGTDGMSGGVFTFTDKNAGTGKTVTVSGVTINDGNNGGNYDVSYLANTSSTIDRASISAITGIAALDKIYDGTTRAELDTSGAVFNGMIAGDMLTVGPTATGTFVDPNPGRAKTVSITGLALGGVDASNYILANITAAATANIEIVQPPLTPMQASGFAGGNNALFGGLFSPSTSELFTASADLVDTGLPSTQEHEEDAEDEE